MTRFRSRIQYSQDVVRRLCHMQYDLFSRWQKLAIGLAAVLLLCFAITTDTTQLIKFICLALGGLLAAMINYPPEYKAKLTAAAMKGNYPVTTYTFNDDSVVLESDGQTKELDYSSLTALAYDSDYIYMFVSRTSAYMTDKKRLKPADPAGLVSLLAEKTGLTPRRKQSLAGISLSGLFNPGRRK